MDYNELMNRRRFFKKTAREMLPMLGAFVAAPTVIMSTLTSCSNDDSEEAYKDGGTGNSAISNASGEIDGYEYVELGLSVKWARYNLGTSKPEGFGSYYAFGDPSGNNINSENDQYSYYDYGKFKSKTSIAGGQYDSAKYKWGNKWRMPTKSEFAEWNKTYK